MTTTKIINGDNIKYMKTMKENSIDSIVTDPPYGLQFMGEEWDKLWRNKTDKDKEYVDKTSETTDGLTTRMRSLPDLKLSKGKDMEEFHYQWGVESLRVAKPGAHMLAFGSPKLHHRMMSGLEDAGWEIRDTIMWVYGQGFPKSYNISKGIDKMNGVEREVIGENPNYRPNSPKDNNKGDFNPNSEGNKTITISTSPDAIKWDGWGTALKPSWEPIVLCRKPLHNKTIVENVLEYNTGGININKCRITFDNNNDSTTRTRSVTKHTPNQFLKGISYIGSINDDHKMGRWPANLIHDGSEEVVELFPYSKSGKFTPYINRSSTDAFGSKGKLMTYSCEANEGSASRFFYCGKTSTQEKGVGNIHPTVKPLKLIKYLINLITPPNGVILDMFGGSGTTGVAAKELGYDCILIEREKKYCDIIKSRVK